MGVSLSHAMGRSSPAESDIYQAVEAAISSGMDAREFIQTVRIAWDDTLASKAKRDDATFVSALKT